MPTDWWPCYPAIALVGQRRNSLTLPVVESSHGLSSSSVALSLQYPTTGSARAGGLVDQWVTHRKPARLARMPLRSQLIHDT